MKKFFKSNRFGHITTFVAIAGNLASYVQAYKIFMLRSSYAVSLPAAFISLIAVVIWFIYGISHNIKPLIYANIFGFIGVSLLILGTLIYPGG